jgi:LDH2 family malate/lactate/ureidoglycolate dehydrogenase
VLRETEASALVDGCWAFGQVSAELATDEAIARAREHGVGAAGLVRAMHIGRLGEYSGRAAAQGVIAMVFAGGFTGRGAAPYGGAAVAFGTNPLSFAFPVESQPDVLVDFATSAVAAGKIRVARAKGEQLPPDCIVDSQGRPTTDPEEFYRGGMLLPFGGHKGYGLAVAVELLGQALTGADSFAEESRGGPTYGHSGALFIALNAELFRGKGGFQQSAGEFVSHVRAVPPAPGSSEVLLPGDPERRTREQRLGTGIPVPESTWDSIKEVADRLGVVLA